MKRRLWLWFLGGFVVTFVVLGTVLTVHSMVPSGKGVMAVSLWRYYDNEWPRAFGSSSLGPGRSNQEALLGTTLQHVTLSAVGGAAAFALGWWLRRRSVKSMGQ